MTGAWLDPAAIDRRWGPLYALYREPGRHVIGLLEEQARARRIRDHRSLMRICFISRRYFPAISGMSVYAQNLLRAGAMGHEVVMISQYRGDEAGTRVYGGGPPPPLAGVQVIGLEAVGEQEPFANWERDIETMVEIAAAEHAEKPFDLVHAQYGYPTGLAALEVSRRLGIPTSCPSRAATAIGSAPAARLTGMPCASFSTTPGRS